MDYEPTLLYGSPWKRHLDWMYLPVSNNNSEPNSLPSVFKEIYFNSGATKGWIVYSKGKQMEGFFLDEEKAKKFRNKSRKLMISSVMTKSYLEEAFDQIVFNTIIYGQKTIPTPTFNLFDSKKTEEENPLKVRKLGSKKCTKASSKNRE